jgi:regulator of protease activity HflC (stomatin/prohibitin superfamily)
VLTVLFWTLATIAVLKWSLTKSTDPRARVPYTANLWKLGIGIVLMIGASIFLAAVVMIPAGHRGVVTRFGRVTGRVLGEGINVIVPTADDVYVADVQVKKVDAAATASSRDLQLVNAHITLNYSPSPDAVAMLYRTLNYDQDSRIIAPAIQESVKAATAQYDAEDLITKRSSVRQDIETRLKSRLDEYHLNVDAVQITDFSFSHDFEQSIEQKVVAVQLAQKANNDLQRIKYEAQQKVESGKAEAEVLQLQRAAISPELVNLRRVELQSKALDKWDGRLPQYITETSPVPVIDLFRNSGGK